MNVFRHDTIYTDKKFCNPIDIVQKPYIIDLSVKLQYSVTIDTGRENMKQMKNRLLEQQRRIMDFWINLKDDKNGGFYCKMNYNLVVDKNANKSGIAIARNLWTFSRAYNLQKDQTYLECAHHAYEFLDKNLLDKKNKGAFWMLNNKGQVIDNRKHVYLQAFCIYALSEYYKATDNEDALNSAMELFQLVETVCYDRINNRYQEEFSDNWKEKKNELLSENGIIAQITTNTHLHMLEAYTNLYRINPTNKVRESLENIVDIFYRKIYSSKAHHQKIFFDNLWNEVINLQSYGHDIEASWLIDDALKALGDYDKKYDDMVINLANKILNVAVLEDGSISNECEDGICDYTKIWWVQAEAAVGFYNAYEKTKDEKYLKAFINVWDYIEKYIVDKRENGEWLYSREKDNSPTKRDIVELWKTPYHNGRCCFELYERIMK